MSNALRFACYLFALFPAVGFAAPGGRSAAAFDCPSEIDASTISVARLDAGWTAHVGAPLVLSSANIAAGPPSLGAQVRETNSSYAKGKLSWTDVYRFEGPYPDGKWLECRYGGLGEVVLARQLPLQTVECVVHVAKGPKAAQQRISVGCR